MAQRILSPAGLQLALLAALAGFLGCDSDTPTTEDDTPPVGGLAACVPDGDLGYPGSGVALCAAGFLHREQALECHPELPRAGSPGYPQSRPGNSSCFVDADCRSLPNGYCVLRGDRLLCAYGCRQDVDCAANQLCLCAENLAGTCVAAECRTDADCSQGSLCAGPKDLTSGVPVHFACQSASDECSADCVSGPCHYRQELGRRVCGGPGAVPASSD
jgi:hypothetical protein